MKKLIFFLFSLSALSGRSQVEKTSIGDPPSWAKSVIWYELFVERFHNGDPTNDPTLENITVPSQSEPPPDWKVTPWTSDWYEQEDWAKKTGKPLKETIFFRRYGGDLQGVLDKLDYLKDLGVTALYFRPLNDAPSQHKYDARSYHHIDIHFGPDPEGDKKIIASETPNDPSTWKWTSADKLFLKVIDEAHRRNIRVVMDYSWNHTGILFWAFQEIMQKQQEASTKNWYMIKSFDDPATPQNEFSFDGWLGVQSLPEIKKVDVTTTRVVGHPYEGDIHPEVKQHIFDVTRRWLAPEGELKKGIDGYRLDVADHIGLKFWREFRTVVRSINPDAYLVGEIWWQKWPEQLMNPRPYTSGDIFDAVMFYQIYRPARYFFAKTDFDITAKQFSDSLQWQWSRNLETVNYAMMNTSSTADAPRLLSDFYNGGKYKVAAKPTDDPLYKTGRPDNETYQRLKLYLAHLFTNIGAPSIYNGEEMGMWGGDDPEDRKPLWWKELSFDTENRNNLLPGPKTQEVVKFNEDLFLYYKKLAHLRNSNSVLQTGRLEFIVTEGKHLAYRRYTDQEEIFVYFNVTAMPHTFNLPGENAFVDLMTGNKTRTNTLKLTAYSVAILKRVH